MRGYWKSGGGGGGVSDASAYTLSLPYGDGFTAMEVRPGSGRKFADVVPVENLGYSESPGLLVYFAMFDHGIGGVPGGNRHIYPFAYDNAAIFSGGGNINGELLTGKPYPPRTPLVHTMQYAYFVTVREDYTFPGFYNVVVDNAFEEWVRNQEENGIYPFEYFRSKLYEYFGENPFDHYPSYVVPEPDPIVYGGGGGGTMKLNSRYAKIEGPKAMLMSMPLFQPKITKNHISELMERYREVNDNYKLYDISKSVNVPSFQIFTAAEWRGKYEYPNPVSSTLIVPNFYAYDSMIREASAIQVPYNEPIQIVGMLPENGNGMFGYSTPPDYSNISLEWLSIPMNPGYEELPYPTGHLEQILELETEYPVAPILGFSGNAAGESPIVPYGGCYMDTINYSYKNTGDRISYRGDGEPTCWVRIVSKYERWSHT